LEKAQVRENRTSHILWRKHMTFEPQTWPKSVFIWLQEHLPRLSAETLQWMAALVLHAATVPTLLALMTGLSDRTPSLDIVLFMWAGLVLLFMRAVVLKDMLNIVTVGTGFIVQAVLMALILFK
jgi:hypothetical protein